MSDESIPPQDGTPTPMLELSQMRGFKLWGATSTNPSWSLDINCNHCQARIHYEGLLGDKSPLKVDVKRRALNRQAEQWVQQANNSFSTIRVTPPADLNRMVGIQTRIPMADGSYRRVYRIVPLPDRFVVCPVCKGRVYVC